ncbi:MAG: hypothetical protein GQ557_00215 [Mycoplasmataceae bacterium]|nr:hypothetical protein [Mycoplasmataceae bacterium]
MQKNKLLLIVLSFFLFTPYLNEVNFSTYHNQNLTEDTNSIFGSSIYNQEITHATMDGNNGIISTVDSFGDSHVYAWGESSPLLSQNEDNPGNQLEPNEINYGFNQNGEEIISLPNNIVINDLKISTQLATAWITYDDCDYIYQWGYNQNYQIGNSDSNQKTYSTPHLVNEFSDQNIQIEFVDSSSIVSIVGVNNNGQEEVYVWGDNRFGQLGPNSGSITSSTPQKINWDFNLDGTYDEEIPADWSLKNVCVSDKNSSVVLTDDTDNDHFYIWGLNDYGQLGTESNDFQINNNPNEIKFSEYQEINDVEITDENIALIINNGTKDQLWMWGYNQGGQLGNGNQVNNYVPTPVIFPENYNNIIDVELNYLSSLALIDTDDGQQLYVWGTNQNGKFGTGDINPILSTTPYLIPNDFVGEINNIENSKTDLFLLNEDEFGNQYIYAWGENDSGQLANQSTVSIESPQISYQNFNVSDVEVNETFLNELNTSVNIEFSFEISSDIIINDIYYQDDHGDIITPSKLQTEHVNGVTLYSGEFNLDDLTNAQIYNYQLEFNYQNYYDNIDAETFVFESSSFSTYTEIIPPELSFGTEWYENYDSATITYNILSYGQNYFGEDWTSDEVELLLVIDDNPVDYKIDTENNAITLINLSPDTTYSNIVLRLFLADNSTISYILPDLKTTSLMVTTAPMVILDLSTTMIAPTEISSIAVILNCGNDGTGNTLSESDLESLILKSNDQPLIEYNIEYYINNNQIIMFIPDLEVFTSYENLYVNSTFDNGVISNDYDYATPNFMTKESWLMEKPVSSINSLELNNKSAQVSIDVENWGVDETGQSQWSYQDIKNITLITDQGEFTTEYYEINKATNSFIIIIDGLTKDTLYTNSQFVVELNEGYEQTQTYLYQPIETTFQTLNSHIYWIAFGSLFLATLVILSIIFGYVGYRRYYNNQRLEYILW